MTDVYIEKGIKKVFACAYDWPGWCRSGKDEAAALESLSAFASRYAPVAKRAGQRFDPRKAGELKVVERVRGSANTDFGVPHEVAKRDTTAITAAEGKRLGALVEAAWAVFDEIAADAPRQLRKGPRGGGRDTDKIIEHVLGAEGAYVRKLGLKLPAPAPGNRKAISEFRATLLETLQKSSNGKPLVEKGWPQRYAARRIAWHVLDHAWEIEDKGN
jgi:hypothetical protein